MVVSPISPSDLMRRTYGVQDAPVVASVEEYPHLESILLGLRGAVDDAFGASPPVRFEVATDPDEGDRALFARIQADLAPAEAVRRLETLSDAWWLGALPLARGLLHLDVRRP